MGLIYDPFLGRIRYTWSPGAGIDMSGGTISVITPPDGVPYVAGSGIGIFGSTIYATGCVEVMTTEERAATVIDEGKLVYDSDLNALYVGDGVTPGGIPVGSGGGGTPATVSDIMTGSGASKILNVTNIRGALTAGQAVDVTSQPDGVTGDYKGTFSVTGSLGFASFPKYASGLNYLMIADLTATTSGTVAPSGTWLDGTTTAKSLAAGTSTRVAMLFNAANKAMFTFASTGSVSVSNCREYEVTACTNESIAYIAALNNPDAFDSYYLVKRDMVSPWTYIIDMGESPVTTVAAGLAYQIKAMTGSHIITVDTCPEGYVGRETFVRIFVGQTGNVVVQHPLQLATPLVANAINNCHVSYRDGSAVLAVDDTVGGYVVDAASGTTAGTLYYGLTESATEFISIPGAFDGIPVDLGGASVTTSGTAQKYIVGNGPDTLISGNLNAGAGKLNLSNLALSDVGITGGTMRIPDNVVVSGTVNISSGASAIFNGGAIASGGTVFVAGGSLVVEKVSGSGGVIDLGGTLYLSGTIIGCTLTGGRTYAPGATPTGRGGAVLFGSSGTLTDCTISGNVAQPGGGVCVQLATAVCICSNCTITDNTPDDVRVTAGKLVLSGGTYGVCAISGAINVAGTTRIGSVTGNGSVTISGGAIINLTSSIKPNGGITVLTGGCTVNGVTVEPDTYTSIVSSGGSAVINK